MLTRADFQPQDFEDIINQKGYRVAWQSASFCPCVDTETLHANPACINCDGRGKYYSAPQTIRAIITRQTKEVNIDNMVGVLAPGEAFMTTSHANFLSLWDRCTNLDSQIVHTELLEHDATNGDFTTYPPLGNVIFAFTQATTDSPLITLKQNVDFSVDSTGKITWLNNATVPANNQSFSVRYYCNPVWVVIDTPVMVRDTWVIFENPVDTVARMPIRVRVRLEFFGISNVRTK